MRDTFKAKGTMMTDDNLKELLEAAKGMLNGGFTNQPGQWIKFNESCKRMERAIENIENARREK